MRLVESSEPIMSDVERRFRQYSWNQNPTWDNYKANLVFPDGVNEAEMIEKYKIRFYNQFVEPYDTTPPQRAQPPPTRPSTETQNAPLPPSNLSFSSTMLNLFVLITAGISLFSDVYYTRCLLAAIANLVVTLIRIHGINLGVIAQLSRDLNGQYIFLIVAHMFSPREPILCLVLMIISLYNFATFLNEYLNFFSPTLHRRYTPFYNKLLGFQQNVLIWLAMNEIMLVFYAFLHYFGPHGSLLRIIICVQFVAYRWGSGNHETRAIFGMIGMGLDKMFCHPSCPALFRQGYDAVQNALKGYANSITAL